MIGFASPKYKKAKEPSSLTRLPEHEAGSLFSRQFHARYVSWTRQRQSSFGTIINQRNPQTSMWKQWVNALLGLWTIVIPFTGMVGNTLMWALIITGIAVAVLALWSIQET